MGEKHIIINTYFSPRGSTDQACGLTFKAAGQVWVIPWRAAGVHGSRCSQRTCPPHKHVIDTWLLGLFYFLSELNTYLHYYHTHHHKYVLSSSLPSVSSIHLSSTVSSMVTNFYHSSQGIFYLYSFSPFSYLCFLLHPHRSVFLSLFLPLAISSSQEASIIALSHVRWTEYDKTFQVISVWRYIIHIRGRAYITQSLLLLLLLVFVNSAVLVHFVLL